jgi:hypothetical protein
MGSDIMDGPRRFRRGAPWLAGFAGMALAGWGGAAGVIWARYGRVPAPRAEESDPLLDAFMPDYEVVERHHIEVAAPAGVTLAAAREMDLLGAPLVRAIFRGREMLLGADPDGEQRPKGLLALTQSLGWRVLAEVPGREVVVGAATKPWEANPVFHSVGAAHFAGFDAPGYVKILWTLRADPVSPAESIFRTETRVLATDPDSRAKFRRYWAWLSPGIVLIRRMMLASVKAEAERRASVQQAAA